MHTCFFSNREKTHEIQAGTVPYQQEYSTVINSCSPSSSPTSVVQMYPHWGSRLFREGRVCHNLAVKVSLINIDVAKEGLQATV